MTPEKIAELRALVVRVVDEISDHIKAPIVRDANDVIALSDSMASFNDAFDPSTVSALLDEVERLRAENKALRQALQPFAKWGSAVSDAYDEDTPTDCWFEAGNLRQAAAVYEQTGGREDAD